MVQNPEKIQRLLSNLSNASYGKNFDEARALLDAELQANLTDELSHLSQTIEDSTSRILKSNKSTSLSSDNIAKALVLTTWVLVAATVVVALVTIIPFVWEYLRG